MSPLRGFILVVYVVPTACAVGYKYLAPPGLYNINLPAYVELTLG
jgi:hypothetical protein